MKAKLTFYNTPTSEFQGNVYWGTAPTNDYVNVLWVDVEFARPRLDVFQEVDEDQLKNRIPTYQRQRVESNFDLTLRPYMVDIASRIGLHTYVKLTILSTGEVFDLTNVRYEDNGDRGEVLATGTINFDMESVQDNQCQQTSLTVVPC